MKLYKKSYKMLQSSGVTSEDGQPGVTETVW